MCFYGRIQALLNVLDAMLSQRTMGADTAQHALDALGTAALCPLVGLGVYNQKCGKMFVCY